MKSSTIVDCHGWFCERLLVKLPRSIRPQQAEILLNFLYLSNWEIQRKTIILAKDKTTFFCSECGYESPKWMGKCPSCNEWNTIKEFKESKHKSPVIRYSHQTESAKPLDQIESDDINRMLIQISELDNVLGGGIVMGSVILLAGEPGVGKSTLVMQLTLGLKQKVLYVSGEESPEQLLMRAKRLGGDMSDCYVYEQVMVENVLETAEEIKPELLIIDSVQTLYSKNIESGPGSVSQVRDCTAMLQRFSKTSGIPVIIIGHITKEGSIAGPKLLEHIVDVVLSFEGDRNFPFRILRAVKNRFGSTQNIGLFEMDDKGLHEIKDPSRLLIVHSDEQLSGSVIATAVEGKRTIMIEVQALVSGAIYGTPQRSVTGYDLRRLHMMLAVLEKRAGFPFGANDVFLNIAGGLRVTDTGIDMPVVISMISSLEDIPVDRKSCFCGEIGLSGEIRPTSLISQRIIEANRLGYERIYVPKVDLKSLPKEKLKIEIISVGRLDELAAHVFG